MFWLAKLLVARNPALTIDHAKRLVKVGALGVLLLILVVGGLWLYLSGRSDGKAGEELKQARAATKVVTDARQADEAALGTVEAEKRSADATEARAREAAAGSDDPLRDGLKELGK